MIRIIHMVGNACQLHVLEEVLYVLVLISMKLRIPVRHLACRLKVLEEYDPQWGHQKLLGSD